MPTYFQRPENALKRANEFIDVGKKQRALDALYDVIKSKKHRTWQKIHEPIMNKYLELCVELKKSHIAKEGLFQYRNICQQVNIKSLEDVVRGYLQLAEEKTEAAREESQQAVDNLVDDLDNLHSPESLLLSAVSGEDAQDRTDRVLLTPWVKFLWESYRQCLELLRNNVRVERLYHDIAQQAFRFCLKYNRKTEFRKLCDNLRTHLENILKHQNQQNNINLNNPESQAMHLETRLCQLDSAIQMELWQEAYKAVEDIHRLMTLSKKPPKPQLMANYYQKLSLVLWKAGNYLFHASALFRLFHLSRDLKKNLTPEEVQRMASRVLLATLTIPIPPSRNEIDKYLETDENTMEKQRRLATLLGLSNPPNRSQLIKDLVRFNVIQFVMPQLQDLYRWLEVEFHPLKLCFRVQQCFEFIQKNEDLADFQQYIPALQEVTLMRLLKQVSQVYQTIQFSRLLELAPFANAFYLERIVVDAVKNNDLQVRIDHRTRSLHFGTDLCVAQREDVPEGPHLQNMPSEQIRNQLINMSSVLHRTVNLIQPAKFKQEKEELRQSLVTAYRNTAKKKHLHILARRQIIEERKEMLENLNIQREEEERRLLEEQRRKQMLLEEERLQREADERERQRRLEEHKEIKRKHVKDKIEQLKKTGYVKFFQEMDEEELEKLDAEEIMARQVEQLDRERKELQAKLKAQEKKVDYLERAKRLEEIPLLQKALEDKSLKDRDFWELQEKERIKQMIEERKLAMQHRDRLRRLYKDKEEFLEQLCSARMSVYKAKLTEFEKRLDEERTKRLSERKEERKEERRIKWQTEKEEESLRKKEEEHRRITEEQEREKQAKLAAEQAAYQAHKEELERIAAKQRARELEIEEKERQRQEEERSRGGDKDRSAPRRLPADDWRRKGEDRPETEEKVGPWKPSNRDVASTSWRQREKERQDSWRPRRDDLETSRDDLESSKLEDLEQEKRDPSNEREPERDSIWRSTADQTDGIVSKEEEKPRDENVWRRGADRERAPPPKEEDSFSREDRSWRRDEKRSFGGGREEGSRFEDTPRPSERGVWGRRDDRGGGGGGSSGWRSREDANTWRDDDKDRSGAWRSSGPRDRDFRRDDRDEDRRGFRDSDRGSFRDGDRGGFRDGDRGGFRDSDRGGFRDGDRGGFRDSDRGGFRDSDRGGFRDSDRSSFRDSDRGGFRDSDRGGFRDGDRGGFRDGDRGGFRDSDRGDSDRRGMRDFERRSDRDLDRRSDRDRDLDSRSTRDLDSRSTRDLDSRGTRDLDRRGDRRGGGERDMERRPDRFEDRDMGSWRMKEERTTATNDERDWRMDNDRAKPPSREEKKDPPSKVVLTRKPELRRKEEPDEEGWTTVRR